MISTPISPSKPTTTGVMLPRPLGIGVDDEGGGPPPETGDSMRCQTPDHGGGLGAESAATQAGEATRSSVDLVCHISSRGVCPRSRLNIRHVVRKLASSSLLILCRQVWPAKYCVTYT